MGEAELTNQQSNQSNQPTGGSENLESLKTQLEELTSTVKSLKEAKESLEKKLEEYEGELLSDDYLSWKEGKKSGKKEESDNEGESDKIDLENASPKDIALYLERKYKGDLNKAVEDVSSRVANVEERIGYALARVDMELTALKYPDFWQYKDRMIKIAEENPTWGAEKVYKQAKLEAKVEEEERAKKEEEKKKEEMKLVSEKGSVPPSVVQGKQLSKEEAARLAYKLAFGNQPINEE